jgi:hypothetical protein
MTMMDIRQRQMLLNVFFVSQMYISGNKAVQLEEEHEIVHPFEDLLVVINQGFLTVNVAVLDA